MGTMEIITDRNGQPAGAEYTPTQPMRTAPFFEANVLREDRRTLCAIFLTVNTVDGTPYVIVEHAHLNNEDVRAELHDGGIPDTMIDHAMKHPGWRLYGSEQNWSSNNESRWPDRKVPKPRRLIVS